MVVAPVVLSQYMALVQRGQDDAASFLRTGKPHYHRNGAMVLCPLDADVSKNVCHASQIPR